MYHEKYLKYKSKYILLKKELDSKFKKNNVEHNQKGGVDYNQTDISGNVQTNNYSTDISGNVQTNNYSTDILGNVQTNNYTTDVSGNTSYSFFGWF